MNVLQYRFPGAQRGLVMISALLLLLVATILAVSMFRSFGTQEKIAGNLREKERAMHAAVTAQQYAEWWLSSGAATTEGVCNSQVDSTAAQVCTNLPANVTSADWPVGFMYSPPDPGTGSGAHMDVSSTTIGAGTYFKQPMFYITDLTPPGAVGKKIFQIDAIGFGGTADAVAVVESTYQESSDGHCPDPVIC
jgi:type IV pilus assembly protein PilX